MLCERRWLYRASLLALCAAVYACAEPRERPALAGAPNDCEARLVVTFAAPADAGVMAEVAAAARVRLTLVERLLPEIWVVDLAASSDDAACTAALARLRSETRVRAAELDTRRVPNGA